MAGRSLRIGELAAQASLRPSALRYYEQIGLIPPPERIGGQRAYPPSTVRRIALIRMAQQAGLPLAEIRALCAGATPGTSATRHWRAMAERKLPEIDAMIEQLRLLRGVVADCLECGCMNFATSELLGRVQPEEPEDCPEPPAAGRLRSPAHRSARGAGEARRYVSRRCSQSWVSALKSSGCSQGR